MRKSISFFLIVCLLGIFFNIKPMVRTIHAADLFIVSAIVYLADQTHKWSKKVNKKKGYTETVYVPDPGYGEADRYWKFEDITNHYRENQKQYSFIDTFPPAEALASLPEHPNTSIGIASRGLRASAVASDPIKFPWKEKKSILKVGDIIFTRANTTFSSAYQYVSSWVHAGVVYDLTKDKTLESFYPDGVRLYNPITDWPKGYSWSVKRVKPYLLSDNQIVQAVKNAEYRYTGKPYFPQYFASYRIRQDFISEFADKKNNSSYYCTKLVWRIFKDAGVDLDSERTTAKLDNNFVLGYTDWGAENRFAWIGVSGDDIYYSKNLDSDVWTYGLNNLSKPLN